MPLLRLHVAAQAQAIQGMEQARVIGEELQRRAKARVAELAAEVKIRDEGLKAKEALLQTLTKSKDDMLQAKDAEIRLLHVYIALLSAQAAAGAAPPSAPAPAAAGAARQRSHDCTALRSFPLRARETE